MVVVVVLIQGRQNLPLPGLLHGGHEWRGVQGSSFL